MKHANSQCHLREWNFKLLLESFLDEDCLTFFCGSTAKHFQRRSVSSAAAETTVLPSGDIAMCNTRAVWPGSHTQKPKWSQNSNSEKLTNKMFNHYLKLLLMLEFLFIYLCKMILLYKLYIWLHYASKL